MYSSLDIKRFGKFAGERFSLAPVTIFFGPNESGKSTLCDIFYYCLCRPQNKGRGKELRQRYGTTLDVALRAANGELLTKGLLEESLFFNIHAVQASDLALQGERSGWFKELEDRILSGGVNPEMVAQRLDRIASADGKTITNRSLVELRRRLAELNVDWVKKRELRQRVLDQEKNIEQTRNQAVQLEQEKIALQGRLADMEQHFITAQRLLAARILEVEKQLSCQEQERRHLLQSLEESKIVVEKRRAEWSRRSHHLSDLEQELNNLNKLIETPLQKAVVDYNKFFLFCAGASFIAAVVLGILVSNFFVLLSFGGLLFLLLARQKRLIRDLPREQEITRQLVKRWRPFWSRVFPDDISLDGFKMELTLFIRETLQLERDLTLCKETFDKQQDAMSFLERSIHVNRELLKKIQGEADDWPERAVGCEIQDLVQQRQLLQGQLAKNAALSSALALGIAKMEGEAFGSLQTIPSDLAILEQSIREINREIIGKEQAKAAASLAASLFRQISSDTRTTFLGFSANIARRFGAVVDYPEAMVELSENGLAQIKAQDYQGNMRSLQSLSSGTQDAFLIALRLCLAENAPAAQRILIFDDPFVLLDEVRRMKTIALLADFQRNTSWQFIFMVKQQEVAAELTHAFPQAMIHVLQRN